MLFVMGESWIMHINIIQDLRFMHVCIYVCTFVCIHTHLMCAHLCRIVVVDFVSVSSVCELHESFGDLFRV